MGKGAIVGPLHRILSPGNVVADVSGHAEQAAIVPLHDEPDHRPIVVVGLLDQGLGIKNIEWCRCGLMARLRFPNHTRGRIVQCIRRLGDGSRRSISASVAASGPVAANSESS